jgi:glucans biosynthesis protein
MAIIRTACIFVIFVFRPLFGAEAYSFGFEDVAVRAKKLADQSYQNPDRELPAELKNLSYDQYRDIRFKPENPLWRNEGLPFEAAFFHRGGFFQEPVKISEIAGNTVQEIKFDPARFSYGANKLDLNRMHNLGFAGFRLHYPINRADYKDEVIAFLGASYFRALGKNQLYGISARGLAIDTAQSSGEEFPRFTEFWLERPQAGEKNLTFYALLDSPRASGAYRFVLTPGNETLVDVKVRIFLRDKIALVGIAPLTSMYLSGENQRLSNDDYRPEVHDSDGLSIRSDSGEWTWRPLVNPKRLLVTSFSLNNPAGFGLMQRDRKFDHYEDLEAHYQQRPSLWIEPKGKWGTGRVELVQIPVPDETNDNIVAYWVSDSPLQPGTPRDFEYRMHWQKNVEARSPDAWVVQTRRGRAYEKNADGSIGMLVDFDGPALRALAEDAKPGSIVSTDANGQLLSSIAYRNDVNGGWRLSLRLRRVDADKPVEIRAQLRINDNKESEIWSYILPAG